MLTWKETIIRLLLASLFGALIGLERERKNWTAGMRTHMMVCVGAALIMMVSAFGFDDVLQRDHIALDPSRMAAQVVSGIGFLGAGTILFLKQGGTIRGLTTASGLWTVAAIGLATGGGLYFAAAATTLLAIIILLLLQPFENRISQRFKQQTLAISITDAQYNANVLETIEQETGSENIRSINIEKRKEGAIIHLALNKTTGNTVSQLIIRLQQKTFITDISWIK